VRSRSYTLQYNICIFFFFLVIRQPPRYTLFPYTTLFLSHRAEDGRDRVGAGGELRQRRVREQRVAGADRVDHAVDEGIDDDEGRSEEHTSELQSRGHLVCRLLLEKKNGGNA